MWALFGPSKVFIVFGLIREGGFFYREKFLGCFANKRVADGFAAQVRSAGKYGEHIYFKVEVREELVNN